MARVNILDTSKSSPYCVKLMLMLQLEKLAIFGSAVFITLSEGVITSQLDHIQLALDNLGQ